MFRCELCGNDLYKPLITEDQWCYGKCAECGLISLYPMPDKDMILSLYKKASGYLNNRLQGPDRYTHWVECRNKRLSKLVGSPPYSGASILDVGCATGLFLSQVKENGWQAYGIEVSEHTAEFARSKYGLDVRLGGAEDILSVFGDGVFDVITLWDVIEHLHHPMQTARHLYRALKPGGQLYLATPNADGWVAQYHWQTARRWWNYWPHPEPPYHLYQFDRQTIRRMVSEAGFGSIRFVFDEIPLWYTCGYIGEPSFRQVFRDPTYIPHGRRLYLLTLPVFWAARIVRRGDAMIVVAEKN